MSYSMLILWAHDPSASSVSIFKCARLYLISRAGQRKYTSERLNKATLMVDAPANRFEHRDC